jgi:glutamyl-tRNA synthetase
MASPLTGPVRVRFAPSPTGYLHVGGARTAIYNELLRRSLGGAFVLRIEDTDRARSDAAMTEQIKSALAWIGVEWDEGPFLQSERLGAHRAAAERLLAEGKAYPSFTTQEELGRQRREATATKGALRYRDVFGRPPAAEVERRLAAGEPYSVRFPLGEEDVVVRDFVRGEVTFKADVLDDFVILRSDGTPTYHLSVVCDDIDMGITHVIRGEDHLSNTPKHVALFRALGAEEPAFGHLPLILGADNKRLSKRTGATSVEELRDQGYLPQALYNYLALLGWSPGGDREVMSREEMVELFTAERLGASASVFDREKLAWMSSQYMSGLPLAELLPHLAPFLAAAGLAGAEGERLHRALEVHRTRAKTLVELAGYVQPYFRAELDYDRELCAKLLANPETSELVAALAQRYEALEPFDVETTEAALRRLAEERGVKAGAVIHPTRMALTGSQAGPPLFDVVAAMGRAATVRHLRAFAAFLRGAA